MNRLNMKTKDRMKFSISAALMVLVGLTLGLYKTSATGFESFVFFPSLLYPLQQL